MDKKFNELTEKLLERALYKLSHEDNFHIDDLQLIGLALQCYSTRKQIEKNKMQYR